MKKYRKSKIRISIFLSLFLLTFVIITGYSLFNTNITMNTKGNLKEYIKSYDCTGKYQEFTAPYDGNYKMEVWGAQGTGWANSTQSTVGGYGGYATGIINLSKNSKLYISVGCKNDQIWNGGGNGKGVSGGDATSIQNILLDDGQLKDYENNKENIIIVAGGGAGSEWEVKSGDNSPSGGSGGGYKGADGLSIERWPNLFGYGGTQTSGGKSVQYERIGNEKAAKDVFDGSFGQGGHTENGDGGGQGGGGFYGGGASNYAGGGGGGSGYIGNTLLTNKHMACYNCEESTEESTKTISVTCASESPTKDCAKKGNGYAKITFIK